MRIALFSVLAFTVAACVALRGIEADRAYEPQVILDSYMIAHGMAATYAENTNASPAVLEQLSKLDLRASEAVHALAERQGADPSASVEAVAALAEYTARQSAAAATR